MLRRWFPKTLVGWTEPRLFTRWRTEEELKAFPWNRAILLFSLLLLGLCFVGGDGFRIPPREDLFQTLIDILILALIPTMARNFTRQRVRITERGFDLGYVRWRFDQVLRAALQDRELNGHRFTLLRIEEVNGKSAEVAVAETISLEQLREVLLQKGVRFGT